MSQKATAIYSPSSLPHVASAQHKRGFNNIFLMYELSEVVECPQIQPEQGKTPMEISPGKKDTQIVLS